MLPVVNNRYRQRVKFSYPESPELAASRLHKVFDAGTVWKNSGYGIGNDGQQMGSI
jgi:hypothetical protein